MANKEHLEILKQGITAWNQWRNENPEINPDLSFADLSGANLSKTDLTKTTLSFADLSGADLTEADLSGADLTGANLSGAELSGAKLIKARLGGANLREADLTRANLSKTDLTKTNLSFADLSGADLTEADLSGADLTGANLSGANLSGAVTDEYTKHKKAKGCQSGVNGLWSAETDSAALMTLNPPGNSMQGSNADVVIESLKRARNLHAFSMTLAGFVFFIAILQLKKIEPPFINLEIPVDKFALFAMPISIGILSLVGSFMAAALKGARYLNDRNSAMKVGNFPWLLSKYAGGGWATVFEFSSWSKFIQALPNMFLSLIARLVMAFHPAVYLYYWFWGEWEAPTTVYFIFLIPLLWFSVWIFVLSWRFQRPILFDTRTENKENNQKDNMISIEAMVRILVKRGFITKKEIMDEVKQVKLEQEAKRN